METSRTLVVYDSFFGNTETVAREIGKALDGADVQVLHASEVKADQLHSLYLLVVGSPTRGFNPSPRVRSLLKRIPEGALKGTRVAAFDTRVNPEDVHVWVYTFLAQYFGYAAESIQKKLLKKGGIAAGHSAGFCVKGTKGPLQEGELKLAAKWAQSLLKDAPVASPEKH